MGANRFWEVDSSIDESTLPADLRLDTLHFVIDIETLGTQPTALPLSIGSVGFRLDMLKGVSTQHEAITYLLKGSFYSRMRCGIEDIITGPYTHDESTSAWWVNEVGPDSDAYKHALLPNELQLRRKSCPTLGRKMALGAFASKTRESMATFAPHGLSLFYGNSPSFDMRILEHAGAVEGVEMPWQHWNQRDLRTSVKQSGIFWHDIIDSDERLTHHIAADDAVAEAAGLFLHLNKMRAMHAALKGATNG